jgi:aspartyl-tRNA(Asn)/glutamyl-tRNA(Gln) amidotransferase subunit C
MIDREQVRHVAKLARLSFSDEEVDRLAPELSKIVEYVEQMDRLDLEGVEPTSHPLDLVNVWGADEPRPSLSREEALANAPDPAGGAFRVPAVGA